MSAPLLRRIVVAYASAVALALIAPLVAAQDLVISQVYTTGGSNGATYTNDYVEIFNRGTATVALDGKTIQYASAAGGGTFGQNPITALTGNLAPGQYYLVRMSGGPGGNALPFFDASGLVGLAVAGGKVALVDSLTGLPCNGGTTKCSQDDVDRILDLVGYGTANFFEGSASAPAPTLTEALFRSANGCRDTNNNESDLAAAPATPRYTGSPANPCTFEVACPSSLSLLQGSVASALLTGRDASGTVASASIVSATAEGIALTGFASATEIGGTASVTLEVGAATLAGSYAVEVEFASDAGSRSCTVQVNVADPAPGLARIHDIQGVGHRSPLEGQAVGNVPGTVTAVRATGFYLQDPAPDADAATSEGIFVFTRTTPALVPGDAVLVTGTVIEFRPGSDARNLTVTNLDAASITRLSSGNPLPAATVVGMGGRTPPSATIDAGNCGDVEAASCSFDPARDAIDFYESMEGMLVQLNNAVASGPTNAFGETAALADFGTGATQITPRGGVYVSPADFNPERVILDDQVAPGLPPVNTRDGLGTLVGVLDYTFGNYKLNVTQAPLVSPGAPSPEATAPQQAAELAIAALNVENLSAVSAPEKLGALGAQIAASLASPDIIAVSEVQDDNGALNDGTVAAGKTFSALAAAIAAAGGPAYQYRSIDPADDQDGGEPGGNIRVGFLFNPARVTFVDRAGGGPTSATKVVDAGGLAQLSASPGRIDPENPAFAGSRKPLAGEFRFNGHSVIVIANHFNSKGGDSGLFGRYQPPQLVTQPQREQQAGVVRDFVQQVLAVEPDAKVVVLGDLNDFPFSGTLATLKSAPLHDLGDRLPDDDRYTLVFDGNSQALDHILVSASLAKGAAYDIVHVNAEYADAPTDHDPVIARLYLPAREVTGQTATAISGLVYVRARQRFTGSVRVSNTTGAPLEGPVQVQLYGLPMGVTLDNATGTYDGHPYITLPDGLPADATVSVPVQFANPSLAPISYILRVYAGRL